MYLDLSISKIVDREEITKKVEEMIAKEIKENKEFIEKAISECIKGAVKLQVNNILQSNEYRTFLRDKILEQLNIKEI